MTTKTHAQERNQLMRKALKFESLVKQSCFNACQKQTLRNRLSDLLEYLRSIRCSNCGYEWDACFCERQESNWSKKNDD